MSAFGPSATYRDVRDLVGVGWKADIAEVKRLTHIDRLLRDFSATQHVNRAAIPTYKCSISYSITSSARVLSASITRAGIW